MMPLEKKTGKAACDGEGITLAQALLEGTAYLEDRDITDASIDAWYLLEYVTGMSRAVFLAERSKRMDKEQYRRYLLLLEQRGKHIPLQHITGEQEFMGLAFLVNEHVLVPRQDTEVLVEEALAYLHPGMQALDLCTGSGCIAVSLAKFCPGAQVDASDISREALCVASQNAARHHAAVHLIHSDLFEKIETEKYDLIVSNPPYIRTDVIAGLSEEVRLHEPMLALDGSADGLLFYRRIVQESAQYLKEGGWLLFEIGYDQGEAVSAMMRTAGYEEVTVLKDLAGLDRVVKGRLGKGTEQAKAGREEKYV